MQRMLLTSLTTALAAIIGTAVVHAQAPAQPTFATTKVAATDNVYFFRYQGHQAMFVVTPEGVIATDPISEDRPAAAAFLAEIRKITQAPIRYVVYSHGHADHIAGGKPFKDAGATFVAHRIAKERLARMNRADIVPVDETVDDKRTLSLGGTELELLFLGKNHSDNMLVMRLPRERILFTVDWIPVAAVMFQNMPDSYLPDFEESLKRVLALDWDRMIPGHPGPGGRLGTKADVQYLITYLQELSAEAKTAATAGKCPDAAKNEIKMPKYASWTNYDRYLPGNIERYCTFWTKGQ
jgi:glyoxylase-like metal-dependent hydrolase (beta-lactamase superfamily II)